jgi:glyoxylase-like metal-dependent hydrolase (beta-lactamase superfamily II)
MATTTFTVTTGLPPSSGGRRSGDRTTGDRHGRARLPDVTLPDRHPTLTSVATGITQVDTVMVGEPEFNAVYVIAAAEPTLVEAGPGADGALVLEALDRLGIGPSDLANIVVTHVHLDHAGGAGALMERFPRAVVWVHERGAPHLVDPSRLVASTARTFGIERMRTFYGETSPVEADRVHSVDDGTRIPMGDRSLEVLATPGHASHHIALADDATGAIFTGEAIGSHLPWADCYRPALPPPEVDVDRALESIERIRARRPETLLTSHFGAIPDAEEGCDRGSRRIREWSETARRILDADGSMDEPAGVEAVATAFHRLAAEDFRRDSGREIELDRYNVIGSIEMNAAGLSRYWRKRWEAEQKRGRSGGG